MDDVVVLGAGHAGMSVVDGLRAAGYAGGLVCIDRQPHRPYERPPLSKEFLLGKPDAVWLRPEDYFTQHAVDFRPGAEVTAIDPVARRLTLADGSRLAYATLVVATGARNRRLNVPGEDLPGVVGLRTLDDARRLSRSLPKLPRLVVVGAGFIGLEVAAAARANGVEVTVLESAPRALSRAASPETSERLARMHQSAGVDFRFREGVTRFLETDGSLAVESTSGECHPASLVVVGAGVVPETRLAEQAGLRVGDGVMVDHQLRTSDPHIFAVGDCVRFPTAAGTVRLESVQNATDQGTHVASTLMGLDPGPYAALPWFWSDQGPIHLQIAGLSAPGDSSVLRVSSGPDRFSVFRYRDDRLAAVESVNEPSVHAASRKILQRRVHLSPEQAADPDFDLRKHVRTPAG